MKKIILLNFCISIFIVNYLFAQDTSSVKSQVIEGNKLLEKGHFAKALPIWLAILEKNPENGDVNFKTGLCYRYSFDSPGKALPYFKKAAAHTISQYNFYNLTWGQAGFDALYFLAETYLILNEPDSAIKYFLIYNDLYNGNPPINADKQIRTSLNAKNAVKSPRNVKLVNLGKILNSEYPETNPVLTLDNSVIFFSSRRPGQIKQEPDPITGMFNEDIYYARKDKDGKWMQPQPFKHNSPANEAPVSLSADGLTLFFRKDEKNSDVNIYQSTFSNGVWNTPQRLPGNINSSANESGMTVTADGKYLYFSSNRVNGEGNMDIYQCTKQPNGNWSNAKNLGKTINTSGNEISPFIGSTGKTLFFSSNGHRKGMGGFDIYFTELKDDGTWSDPQNIGYPINTSMDNLDYYISSGGLRYGSAINEGKSYDLYEIQGGGYEAEIMDVGKEVVTLTTEMNVTEVIEVEKQVTKEVEVVQMVDNLDPAKEKEVEVVNLEDLEKLRTDSIAAAMAAMTADSLQKASRRADSLAKIEAEKPKLDFDVQALNLEELDSVSRILLIDKVKKYLTKQLKSNESIVFKTLYFDFNSFNLSLLSKNELKLLLDFLKENPNVKLEIAGHADDVGSWDANIRISAGRAKVVHDYLISRKISEKKILSYGKASASPIADNKEESGRKLNRRVEIFLVR